MFSFISSLYISESILFFWLLSLILKICSNQCCVLCLNYEFKSVNKTVSLKRYLMFFKLNYLFHDFVLFVYFKTFNILFTTAFLTDSKNEWSSKVVFFSSFNMLSNESLSDINHDVLYAFSQHYLHDSVI